MFDGLKNMGNMFEMMKNAGALKAQMQQMQEELASKAFEADAGDGRVVARVNGKMQLEELRLDKDRLDLSNTDMLEDMIVLAVNAAQAQAATEMKTQMEKITKDLGLPPGLI